MYQNNIALLALTLVVIVGLGQWVYSFIRVQAFKRRMGCKPATQWGQRDPVLGLDQFRIFKQNAVDRKTLESLTHRYISTQRHTQTLRLMGQDLVMTCEPENVKAVLATKFADFGIGSRMGAMGRLLGYGIFTTDGKHWEHSRALIRPSFSRAQVSDLDCVETHVQNLINQLPADGETIDLQRLFFNFTIDNATEFLLGRSINCQTNPSMEYFSEAWDHAEGCLSSRVRLGKVIRVIDAVKTDAGFEKSCDTVHTFVDSYIADTLQEGKNKKNDSDAVNTRRYNLLSELSAVCRDPAQLRSELLNVLLAARDTTAALLSSVVYFLSRHPDVWESLASEVDQLEGRVPDYETLKGMRVLRSIVDETLRLHPPVPINMRFAVRDTTVPRGGGPDGLAPVFVPKGAAVHYSLWAMHRLPSIYGPDAETFRPSRWLDSKPPLRPGWGYLPFNGGPRVCLGQQSALIDASYVVVRLVQHVARIEPRGGVFRESIALTFSHADGVKVGLWKRV
ncbi:putative N-alkane-inducible cytochrome P450 [Ophiobolus disseminans]|uniref:Putative N-alkane-inducible cytochrome P450 n=1 Tax=Ophiobolus disseminans TaxID=1469910 RepID=A0A6A6ZDM8_9PLEO|nr:putative N-alkane-inducible cytochrome P450 [Ophiobolus disseminans]